MTAPATPGPVASFVRPAIAPGEASRRRPDIQGLRAIAVGLVVAFHAGLPLPGGFVGVDVFFVISGFVITAMLMREQHERGRISFSRFYGRRFLRLTPALALLVCVVALASFALQNPFGAQQATASTGLGAMLLSANIVIAHASGDYFADAAVTNPLLNTWSLSVEEQFYLVFPALLALGWLLARRTRVSALLVVGILAIASFAASLIWSYSTSDQLSWFGGPQSFAYYSAPTRAWEFAVGSALALGLAQMPVLRGNVLAWLGTVGLLLIVGSALVIDESMAFPGLAAVVPVVGTLLLLVCGSQGANAVSDLLGTRAFTSVGDLSYSWYLWHWPVIVFAVLLWPQSALAPVLAAIVSLLPAVLSYRFVESPLRRLRSPRVRGRVVVASITLGLPLALCTTLLIGANTSWGLAPPLETAGAAVSPVGNASGAPAPLTSAPVSAAAVEAGDDGADAGGLRAQHVVVRAGCVNVPVDTPTCRFGPSGAAGTVLLAGDSQSYAVADGVIAAAGRRGLDTVVTSHTGCPFLAVPSSGSHDIPCASWQRDVLSFAQRTHPTAVVIANRSTGYVHPELHWRTVARRDGSRAGSITEAASLYRDALTPIVRQLTDAGIPVVILASVPDMTGYVDRTSLAAKAFGAADFGRPRAQLERQRDPALRVERSLASADVAVVDPFPDLCDQRTCWGRRDGQARYQDETHVSVDGSLRLQDSVLAALPRG